MLSSRLRLQLSQSEHQGALDAAARSSLRLLAGGRVRPHRLRSCGLPLHPARLTLPQGSLVGSERAFASERVVDDGFGVGVAQDHVGCCEVERSGFPRCVDGFRVEFGEFGDPVSDVVT